MRALTAEEVERWRRAGQEYEAWGKFAGHARQGLEAERLNGNYCVPDPREAPLRRALKRLQAERSAEQAAWAARLEVRRTPPTRPPRPQGRGLHVLIVPRPAL